MAVERDLFGAVGNGEAKMMPLWSARGGLQWRYALAVTLATPQALAPGDTIAVVAPSGPIHASELWRGLAWLRARYRIRIQPGALARDGYLAGGDDRRGDELARAMGDHEVKAIAIARGGYGSMRIVEALPWNGFAKRPKWIVGFSDVTALHAMAWRVGIASVHAPNVVGLGHDTSVATRAAWLASLERPTSHRVWRALRVVCSGEASGPIVGGNLALVHAMAAAGRLSVPKAAVLALEDVGEAPYRVDRMLTALRLGGHLSHASAIIFGAFDRCTGDVAGPSVDEALDRCTRSLGIPVLAGAPFGHGERNLAFVLGASVQVRGGSVTWGDANSPSG